LTELKRRHDHRLGDLQVVALARVAHPVPVEPEQREHEHVADDHEPDRALEQVRVEGRDVTVEAKLEREVVGERHQSGVHRHLREAVTVEREGGRQTGPPAHPRECTSAGHPDRILMGLPDILSGLNRASPSRGVRRPACR
jgi:hypothetical protein